MYGERQRGQGLSVVVVVKTGEHGFGNNWGLCFELSIIHQNYCVCSWLAVGGWVTLVPNIIYSNSQLLSSVHICNPKL